LEFIADMAVDMAKGAHAAHQALPAADTAEGATPEVAEVRASLTLAFARAAGVVERASQLEARLHATGGTLNLAPRAAAPSKPGKSPEEARADDAHTRRMVAGIYVEVAIKEEAHPDEVDDLLMEVHDRLHAADQDELGDLPHAVLVARLCHDLDLPRDWAIWAEDCCPEEVARLDRAKAKPPP
jgi:hypothetical protein